MKRSTLLFVGALMVVMFQNCAQNVSFKPQEASSITAGAGNDAPAPTPPPVDPVSQEYTEHFKVAFNSEAAPLDMIWVVDNSGSMSEEAALVRKNFDAFLTALNMSTNFRLLLISSKDTSKFGVSIPSSFDPETHKQIVQTVDSYNGPSMLLNKVKSLPAGFLRSDSKKIIVFVTDDNSSMSASSFMASLASQQNWSDKDVSVFSFIGQGKAVSPCQAAEGVVYKALASQTGGKTYNICLPEWTDSFSDLMDTSVSKAVRRFSINAPVVKEIVEVRVDGKVLASSEYALDGKAVTLSDSVILSENSQVEVRYK